MSVALCFSSIALAIVTVKRRNGGKELKPDTNEYNLNMIIYWCIFVIAMNVMMCILCVFRFQPTLRGPLFIITRFIRYNTALADITTLFQKYFCFFIQPRQPVIFKLSYFRLWYGQLYCPLGGHSVLDLDLLAMTHTGFNEQIFTDSNGQHHYHVTVLSSVYHSRSWLYSEWRKLYPCSQTMCSSDGIDQQDKAFF